MRFLVILIWLLVAGAVSAQPIIVRSGEHDGFSRLVLKLPTGVDWRLSRAGRIAVLSLNDPDAVFDLGQVFERIPRTRLESASQSGPGRPLNLNLTCDCPTEARIGGDRLLVVDIRDPVSASVSEPSRQTEYRLPKVYTTSQPWLPRRIGAVTSPVVNEPTTRRGYEDRSGVDLVERHPSPGATDGLGDTDLHEQLNLSELRLLEQVGRATRQGLLTPRSEVTSLETGGARERDAAQGAAKPDASHENLPARQRQGEPQQQIQMSAVTSADRDTARHRANGGRSEPDVCLRPGDVAIADWGGNGGFSKMLGELRSRLHSETGDLDAKAHIELARLYLHYGFGLEALRLLESVGETDSILADMARLMDGEPGPDLRVFEGQLTCANDTSLWAFLAHSRDGPALDGEQTAAILRAFAKLPDHLRGHLGPRVSARFLGHGDPDAAASILRLIDPAATEPPDGSGIVQAEIDRDRGDAAAAETHLKDVVEEGSDQSPEALIDLIEDMYNRHAVGEPGLAQLVGAYVTEFGESVLGARLRRANVLSLLLGGDYAGAFSVVQDIAGLDPKIFNSTFADAVVDLTMGADDMTFLALIHQEMAGEMPVLPVSVGNAAAKRLISLGFPRSAEPLMASPISARRTPDRRLLWARVALAGNLPDRAVAELADLEGAEAELLRAEAYLQMGEYRSAAGTFARAEVDNEVISRAKWLGDDLPVAQSGSLPEDRAGGEEPNRFSAVMTLSGALSEADVVPADVASLATARSLLEDSDLTQDRIRDLLTAVPDLSDTIGN